MNVYNDPSDYVWQPSKIEGGDAKCVIPRGITTMEKREKSYHKALVMIASRNQELEGFYARRALMGRSPAELHIEKTAYRSIIRCYLVPKDRFRIYFKTGNYVCGVRRNFEWLVTTTLWKWSNLYDFQQDRFVEMLWNWRKCHTIRELRIAYADVLDLMYLSNIVLSPVMGFIPHVMYRRWYDPETEMFPGDKRRSGIWYPKEIETLMTSKSTPTSTSQM